MSTVLGSANGARPVRHGRSTVTVPGATAGERFYIKVQGANTTAFGTGDYALGMSFNGTTPPTEASPIIAYPNGTPLHSGGGSPDQVQPGDDVLVGAAPTIMGISPDTGASPSDGITNVNRIVISGIAANNETINVYINGTLIGTTTTNNQGNWTFDNTGTALAGRHLHPHRHGDRPGRQRQCPLVSLWGDHRHHAAAGADHHRHRRRHRPSSTANSTDHDRRHPRHLRHRSALQSGHDVPRDSTPLGTVAADSHGDWDWYVNTAFERRQQRTASPPRRPTSRAT